MGNGLCDKEKEADIQIEEQKRGYKRQVSLSTDSSVKERKSEKSQIQQFVCSSNNLAEQSDIKQKQIVQPKQQLKIDVQTNSIIWQKSSQYQNIYRFQNTPYLIFTDRLLGSGISGSVFLGSQSKQTKKGMLMIPIAVKIFKPQYNLSHREKLTNYQRQLQIYNQLWPQGFGKQNIVQIKNCFIDKGRPIIAMECCDESLQFHLHKKYKNKINKKEWKGISEQDCLSIFEQLVRGLHYLHMTCGIVHCDIKADNVLIKRKEEQSMDVEESQEQRDVVKSSMQDVLKSIESTYVIADFGRSIKLDQLMQIDKNRMLGTMSFMPPQSFHYNFPQLQKQINKLSPNQNIKYRQHLYTQLYKYDIWSLGCILFHMLTSSFYLSSDQIDKINEQPYSFFKERRFKYRFDFINLSNQEMYRLYLKGQYWTCLLCTCLTYQPRCRIDIRSLYELVDIFRVYLKGSQQNEKSKEINGNNRTLIQNKQNISFPTQFSNFRFTAISFFRYASNQKLNSTAKLSLLKIIHFFQNKCIQIQQSTYLQKAHHEQLICKLLQTITTMFITDQIDYSKIVHKLKQIKQSNDLKLFAQWHNIMFQNNCYKWQLIYYQQLETDKLRDPQQSDLQDSKDIIKLIGKVIEQANQKRRNINKPLIAANIFERQVIDDKSSVQQLTKVIYNFKKVLVQIIN